MKAGQLPSSQDRPGGLPLRHGQDRGPRADIVWSLVWTGGVALYLWLRDRQEAELLFWILVLSAAARLGCCERGLLRKGFQGQALWAGLRRWWRGLLAAAVLLVAVTGARLTDPGACTAGIRYWIWALVQQVLYQCLVAQPLVNRSERGCWWAGLLFAAVHLPNPVLVPATLAWGVVACRMFRAAPSFILLALFQTLLASVLYWTVPWNWHRGFRVGISYWQRPPAS